MVNFGERLQTLRRDDARPYIDYEALKVLVEALANDASASGQFMTLLSGDILKVDAFVKAKLDELSRKFRPSAPEAELLTFRAEIAALRQYVGTNVIAITKIVKKHDKHVDASQQKRSAAAALVCKADGLSNLPTFHEKVERALATKSMTLSKANAVTIDIATSQDEDDETQTGLRGLPKWLLHDVKTDDTFFATYLNDWTLDGEQVSLMSREQTPSEAVWEVDFSDDATPFWELSHLNKVKVSVIMLLKISVIVFSLYAFVCSLSFMADGFRLVAGKQAGEVFSNSEIFNNPVAGMLVGVLVTVLVQSSSTSTSIVITMVAAELLTVKQAIPLIMGANIGTSVTSTIVAMGQIGNPDEFQRAFAAATVHDMFNFLTVAIVLPVEACTQVLFHMSDALVPDGLESAEKPPDFLKKLTKPFKKEIISVDKKLISKIASCETDAECAELEAKPMLKYLFDWGPDDISDGAAGALVLTASLIVLCVSLFVIVWTLKSILKGRVAVWLHRSVNGNIPDLQLGALTVPLQWITGYLAMAVGVGVTILVQSSSITTSALTPLVGVGVIKLERMYPTVLGANIGTCVTGVLAAFAASSSKLYLTLQVAYAHLLFNIIGICIWYVIWPLRAVPISMAKYMGAKTARYKWFALAYLFFAFFLVPLLFMGLSLWGTAPVVIATVLVVMGIIFVGVVNTMQARCVERLPEKLRTWDFLPEYLRSLEPIDRLICMPLGAAIGRVCCSCKKGAKKASPSSSTTTVSKITTGSVSASSDKTAGTASTTASEIEVAAGRISS